MSKVEVKLKVDSYKVVSEIVESGITNGWDKANRVSDNPSEATLKELVLSNVMLKLEEYIKFE